MKANEIVEILSEKQIPFVLYKSPEEDVEHLIIDENAASISLNDFSFYEKGFVLFPFDSSHKKGVFFKASQTIKVGIDEIDFSQYTESHPNKKVGLPLVTPKDTYINTVDKAVLNIRDESFKKVVVSKVKIEALNDINDVVGKLFNTYSKAFVYVSYTHQYGLWMGATPETLLSNKKGVIKTVALAGTQSAIGKEEKEAQWTQKEIEEQALVSRYIINCFKKIRLREFEDVGPKTVKAGELFHLKTEFFINEKELGYKDLFGQLVKLLHPTSAVCGMPLQEASQFIKESEVHDRELFTGVLGPINIEGNSHLFVNLRCAKVLENKICCFAGAGITDDSDSEKEWEETELKCETILSLI